MAERNSRTPVLRVAFSTDQLPAELSEDARKRKWAEFRSQVYGEFEESHPDDRPFYARGAFALYGSAGVGHVAGTFTRVANSARDIAAEGRDDFLFSVNFDHAPIIQRQRGRELMQAPGEFALISSADVGEVFCGPNLDWGSVVLARKALRELVPEADDFVARRVDPGQPAARYFRRYLNLLLDTEGVEDDPLLSDHVATTLVDLAALCLRAGRDAQDVAKMRGLRAARLQLVLAEIRNGYLDPALSPERVAGKVGLSPRRMQGLLQETGKSFTERVLELRLQRARAMLTVRRHDGLKVSEIAYASGFNDVSYFNRKFKSRFGASPTQYRGDGS